jgi:CHAD domain-containing protein
VSEREFLLAADAAPGEVADAIAQHLPVDNGGSRETDRTYYDTFDALLREAGLAAAHERGELTLIDRDSGEVRARVAHARYPKGSRAARAPQPLFPSELEPGQLREALAAVVDVRALLPLVRVKTRERCLRVLDDERKTVARITIERPAVLAANGRRRPLGARLRVAAVRGYDSELDQVRLVLAHELGLAPAEQPLLDDAVRASGRDPQGISSKISVPLLFEERSDRAAARVLRGLLDVIEANIEGTITNVDSEFLHDYRVSVRRSRSVQRELKRVFPADELSAFRDEFRRLQRATGDARDLDVYVLEFDSMRTIVPEEMRDDLDPLLAVLQAHRATARRAMARTLRGRRASSLPARWSSFLDGLEQLPDDERHDAARPIGQVAGERIRKVYRKMVKMGGAIDQASPAEDYHELRKRGKELRYLLELFGAVLYPQDVVKPMIKSLKGLQDVLGRHQDREVQIAMLTRIGEEIGSARGGAAALMATGVLVARLHEDEFAARAEFAERFATFASKAQRKLVKDTFR